MTNVLMDNFCPCFRTFVENQQLLLLSIFGKAKKFWHLIWYSLRIAWQVRIKWHNFMLTIWGSIKSIFPTLKTLRIKYNIFLYEYSFFSFYKMQVSVRKRPAPGDHKTIKRFLNQLDPKFVVIIHNYLWFLAQFVERLVAYKFTNRLMCK